jgi:hypothetical protein
MYFIASSFRGTWSRLRRTARRRKDTRLASGTFKWLDGTTVLLCGTPAEAAADEAGEVPEPVAKAA